ncbi:hypothetical protein GCM10023232_20320 [Sphingosinicella ginsenosidimutans]|uniref:Surface-adhesin protein E-like domain-containing protein n=1 Tax=Allosphingosinicella ginsenosidimutans TaxID=1176539 RepID=A0A5C6TS81_9SPHN|nr:hypothetical protein [Sphingosinicella ginsenosidimutans]TXC63050.1 hypothetical protein FRZ32_04845 [Sphingosinicella ginsenosidimutans]
MKRALRSALALSLGLIAGCDGHAVDFVHPRPSIVAPELARFGYDDNQVGCVAARLGASLSVHRLRDLATAAGAVRQGYYDPARLTPRDFRWVAATMPAAAIRAAVDDANQACGVSAAVAPPPIVALAPPSPAEPEPAWLNLGRADSGQSIAVDAASIERSGTTGTAWFRMTDPGADPSPDIFHLVIDCQAHTINATERRRLDAQGRVVETRTYPDNPLPVENGTVMQIAWLSMCT